MDKNKSLVINLFSGPGVGKSTACAGIFYELKKRHYNVELVTEYAKDIVFENRQELFTDQLYILAKQHRRILRLSGKVDIILTDSPILQNLAYTPDSYFRSYAPLVRDVFDSFHNVNFLLKRRTEYVQTGRYQSEEDAMKLDGIVWKPAVFKQPLHNRIDNIEHSLPDMIGVIVNEHASNA